MPGVGDTLAPRLIAEIGDLKRFYNKKALIAYTGIDSPPFESGQFVANKRRISKRGSALLRKTGYEIMKCIKSAKPKG
ncbi:MAG: IS110 family transposase [Clostridium neonatale]